MARYIEVTASDGTISRTRIDPSANRFTVRPGDAYRFIDDNGNIPPGLVVKRYDNHLIVDGLAEPGQPAQDQVSQVELADFYGVCSVANPCQIEVKEAADGAPAVFVDSSTHPIGALADGSFVLYDGGGASPSAAPLAGVGSDEADGSGFGGGSSTLTWGLVGVGVVGLALAAGGGGGGGGSSPSAVSPSPPAPTPSPTPEPTPGAPPPAPTPGTPAPAPDTTPPQAPVIAPVSGDSTVTLAEKAAGVTIAGTGEAGSRVDVTLDGRTHSATVGTNGTWSVQFSAAEIGADGHYGVQARLTDAAGNVSPAGSASFTVNTASNILIVAGDSTAGGGSATVSGAERAAGFSIVGTGPAGSPAGTTVTVTLSGGGASVTREVRTDASNNWTAAFSPSETIPDGTYTVSATGTIGTTQGTAATASVVVDQTPPPPPVISPVTGDNLVTADERAAGIVITGTAEPGSTVHVSIGTTTQVVAADAAGNWATAAFPAPSLPAGSTGVVTAVAIDKAQNQSTPTVAGFAQLAAAAAEHQQPTELGTTLSLDHLVSTHPGETGLAAGTTSTASSIDSPQLINTLLEQPNSGNLA